MGPRKGPIRLNPQIVPKKDNTWLYNVIGIFGLVTTVCLVLFIGGSFLFCKLAFAKVAENGHRLAQKKLADTHEQKVAEQDRLQFEKEMAHVRKVSQEQQRHARKIPKPEANYREGSGGDST